MVGGVLVSPSMVQTVGGDLLVSPSLAQPRDCALRGAASSCRNSKTARNDSDQLGLDPVVIHVSQLEDGPQLAQS